MYKFDGELNFSNKMYINKLIENVTVINLMDVNDKIKDTILSCCRSGKPQIEIFHKGNRDLCFDILNKLVKGAEIVIEQEKDTFDLTFDDLLNLAEEVEDKEDKQVNEFDRLVIMLGCNDEEKGWN